MRNRRQNFTGFYRCTNNDEKYCKMQGRIGSTSWLHCGGSRLTLQKAVLWRVKLHKFRTTNSVHSLVSLFDPFLARLFATTSTQAYCNWQSFQTQKQLTGCTCRPCKKMSANMNWHWNVKYKSQLPKFKESCMHLPCSARWATSMVSCHLPE